MLDLAKFSFRLWQRLIIGDFRDIGTDRRSEKLCQFLGRHAGVLYRVVQQSGDEYIEIGNAAGVCENAGHLKRVVDIRLAVTAFSLVAGVFLGRKTCRTEQ